MEPVFSIQNGGKASALSVSCVSDSFLAFLSRLLKDSTTLQSLQRPQASPGKCVRYFEPPALPTSLEVDPPPRPNPFHTRLHIPPSLCVAEGERTQPAAHTVPLSFHTQKCNRGLHSLHHHPPFPTPLLPFLLFLHFHLD